MSSPTEASEVENTATSTSSVWKWSSLLLIVFGIGLLGFGGWLYYQQYLESIKPPPARIVELSVEEIEATLTPQATPGPSPLADDDAPEEQRAVPTTTKAADPDPTVTTSPSPVSKSSGSDVISAGISKQADQSPAS